MGFPQLEPQLYMFLRVPASFLPESLSMTSTPKAVTCRANSMSCHGQLQEGKIKQAFDQQAFDDFHAGFVSGELQWSAAR